MAHREEWEAEIAAMRRVLDGLGMTGSLIHREHRRAGGRGDRPR
jgi:hypothetical protein